jgi:hypothetical protein
MENKDELMKTVMQNSKLTMPFSDFESRVMQTIEQDEKKAVAVLEDRKRGIYFFLAGMLFGLGLNYLLSKSWSDLQLNFPQQENALLASQIIYAIFILFFIERLVKLYQLNRLIKGL